MKPEEVIPDISAAMAERLKSALEYLWKVQEYPLKSFDLIDVTNDYKKHGFSGDLIFTFQTQDGTSKVGRFALSFMPGCESNVLISHGVEVYEKYQKQGIGQALNRLKQNAASLIKMTMLIATVNLDNAAERTILKKQGWIDVVSFLNTYHNSDVALVYKLL